MTEEMLGGQHRNDECDKDLGVRGEQTNANNRCSSAITQRVCLEEANTSGKKLLQRPTSLEKPDKSGLEQTLGIIGASYCLEWREVLNG
ncbi:MAG: hypothetical protein WCE52_22080 [Candidatus Acidiferrum sp.]